MRAVDSRGEMNQSAARLQSRRCRCDLGVCLWGYLRPLRNGQRPATIALAASGKSLKFGIVGSTIVHWLPQAAGMRCGRRDRQSHRSEHAHKQQNQHESGGQSMHGLQILLRRSDKQSVSGGAENSSRSPITARQFTTIAPTRRHKIVQCRLNPCTCQGSTSLSPLGDNLRPRNIFQPFHRYRAADAGEDCTSRILTPCHGSWPTTSAPQQTEIANREKTQALCLRKRGR